MEITICNGIRERAVFDQLKARGGEVDASITAMVAEILAVVKEKGDAAVCGFTDYFDVQGRRDTMNVVAEVQASAAYDGCHVSEVNYAQVEEAAAQCDPAFIAALRRASRNIEAFHRRQLQQSWFCTGENGVMLGQRVRPLHRVGVYVPGGTAAYPSSVLMNVIPAKIAGVREIIMATPEQKGGGAEKNILAAAYIAGVDRVFLMGGAYAMGALAYGTESVPKVDKIVGPANIFGATAKKLLYGTVDIDMIAGPSEILIVADETADPRWLAADMLSQAEHDTLASAILLSTSHNISAECTKELELQLKKLPRSDIAREALRNFGAIFVCESIEQALEYANEFAPEHLELCVQNPMEYLGAIENAGSVFLGHYTPESVGDYYAGPNHVLPTGGTPRFFSPLSVDDFVKKLQFIHYTRPALEESLDAVVTIAEAEGLTAHANAARVRFE